jgi:hypothetical protein
MFAVYIALITYQSIFTLLLLLCIEPSQPIQFLGSAAASVVIISIIVLCFACKLKSVPLLIIHYLHVVFHTCISIIGIVVIFLPGMKPVKLPVIIVLVYNTAIMILYLIGITVWLWNKFIFSDTVDEAAISAYIT